MPHRSEEPEDLSEDIEASAEACETPVIQGRRSGRKLSFLTVPGQVKLWMLRAFVHCDMAYTVCRMGATSVVYALDLEEIYEAFENDPKRLRPLLGQAARQALAAMESSDRRFESPAPLTANVRALRKALGLSELEGEILTFAVQLQMEKPLVDLMECLEDLTLADVIQILGRVLRCPVEQVTSALRTDAPLVRSGLIALGRSARDTFDELLKLPPTALCQRMVMPHTDVVGLVADLLRPTPAPELTLRDYAHRQADIELIQDHLAQALRAKRAGVNVLLFGPPGTGKTQLARVLAKRLRCSLYEIASEKEDGTALKRRGRLRALQMAQSLFARKRTLLLFDESEDVFGTSLPITGQKAWMNRLLEQGNLPTIWITNAVEVLDPAFVRRFDIVLEMDVPPRRRRAEILSGACAPLLTPKQIETLAEHPTLSPAVVRRAAQVFGSQHRNLPREEKQRRFASLINATLKAQGHRAVRLPSISEVSLPYDPDAAEASMDLGEVARRLQGHTPLRLCLSGPPGTGKSEFGHWLARTLDRPLLRRSASDLLSKWVGGTEQALASAFEEAAREKAILLLDEVDSFLRPRSLARNSWEVTAVNELLTQLEHYEGCFIATTNRMEDLDEAALRRFDLKIQFRYLRPDRAWTLFQRCAQALSLGSVDAGLEHRVRRLDRLAPGDFAVAARCRRTGELASAEALADLLEAECALKPGASRPMGFV